MKVFQIAFGVCYYDATTLYSNVASIPEDHYPPNAVFVEAPDYVREGWGYDETAGGDAKFIEPTPPKEWLYDGETGTFYPNPSYTPPDPSLAGPA